MRQILTLAAAAVRALMQRHRATKGDGMQHYRDGSSGYGREPKFFGTSRD